MAITWPAKNNYATGDVLTATNMNGIGDDLNALFDNSFYAGKNKIINGDFGIWQRGTTFNSIAGGTYTADRWCGNYINGTVNATQQTFTAGTAPVSGYEGTYYLQLARTSTHASIADYFAQRIEDVRTFAGQTVTFSFWAKMSSGTGTLGTYFTQSFGSGGSSESSAAGSTMSLTTTWTRFSTTYTVPSISGKTIGTGSWFGIQFVLPVAEGNKTWQIWGVQLEAGSTATPFQTATGTKQGELAACQRYLPAISGQYSTMLGFFGSTTSGVFNYNFPVQARVAPTGITVSNVSDWGLVTPAVGTGTPTAITWNYGGVNGATVSTTHTAGSPTTVANSAGILRCTGASGYILFTGCEL